MTEAEQKAAAKAFAKSWQGKGYEKGETQPFWLALIRDVYGIEKPENFIFFEEKVKLGHASFIDARIPETHVIIEQKSLGKDLSKPVKQSDGTLLTPYQQAKRYADEQPYSKRPRFIVACNFAEFRVYDMEHPGAEPEIIKLENLPQEAYRLQFLVNVKSRDIVRETQVSKDAGVIVGRLYDALLKEYKDPTNPESLKSLNKLCVRLVFLLYAESAGILGKRNMFREYLQSFREENVRRALIDLFEVLSTKPEERDDYLEDKLAAFPYVNGGLFDGEKIEIPKFTPEILDLLIHQASEQFDWSAISPTIFGAVFESTMNPVTRRAGGLHYTSVENIHKIIDPLFLDDFKREFEEIKAKKPKTKNALAKWRQLLLDFQKKLADPCFLDPAVGSGNFLTESYLSLRRLENEVISELQNGEMTFGFGGELDPIKVSIHQFYGIEINDFAVAVSKAALWIAESQALQETENIVHTRIDFLPLKSYANIVEGNALRIGWGEVVPKEKCAYIIGNPPFVGYTYRNNAQKEDMENIWRDEKGKIYKASGKIDYVSCWHFKAAQFMQNTNIRAAFVSTNSITQGEQVVSIWKPLMERFGVHIDFAWHTFRWGSESTKEAHVHCVIIGFSVTGEGEKYLYSEGHCKEATNISPYLLDSPTVFIENRNKPLYDVPEMTTGNRPADGGHLIIEANDYADFIKKEPKAKEYIKEFMGSEEFINRKPRYCLWLVGVSPAVLKSMPLVMKRVEACREARLKGAPDRQKLADIPTLFRETKNPNHFIIVPKVSSERRRYVPMGFQTSNVIASDLLFIIPEGTLYHFGVLESNVHMSWMRAVAGRLKSDYRYSKNIVYNNFPWPNPDEKQKAAIEQTAQEILNARNLYPDSSLADLYNEALMPPELRKAHQANDRAVMAAYGFSVKDMTEAACVAELMKMYQELTKKV
ncbi:MAG: class I SAM-dependent DNA methyltransferase [Selenomonadaceae bacterium]|nr:class I SAM-dependent DNA methyltransferase [Selenomonadaceae bacterium]